MASKTPIGQDKKLQKDLEKIYNHEVSDGPQARLIEMKKKEIAAEFNKGNDPKVMQLIKEVLLLQRA